MDDSDCVRLIQEMRRPLLRFLNYTKPAGFSFYYWDERKQMIEVLGRKGQFFVRTTVIFHLMYLLLQIYFTIKSQSDLGQKLLASVLISLILMLLQARWEFKPDRVGVQLLNGLLIVN